MATEEHEIIGKKVIHEKESQYKKYHNDGSLVKVSFD